ncbi:MAG: hypothetical protein J6U93_04190 [Alistipes sp.]|nr:hypothetical protein [Alistipes sp.]
MKKFFALLFSVAMFAVGCEGGFDLSDLLRPYLPDPVSGEGIFEVDEDGNYIISPEGANLNINLKDVKQYLDLDLVHEFKFEISEDAQSWIEISDIDDIANGTLKIKVKPNSTDENRYASIKLSPVEDDFLNYTIDLVQMPVGYVHVEKTLTLKAESTSVKVGDVVTFTVTNGAGEDVTSGATIYWNETALESNTYTTTEAGSFNCYATVGEELSKSIKVKVSKK